MLFSVLVIALVHAGIYGRRAFGGPASLLTDLGYLCVTASLAAGAALVWMGVSVAVGLTASLTGVILSAIVIALGHERTHRG
ncbi:hypothetical protein [Caulobacter hibisci]|uniref:Uncharacterized protein n=1 Tax=Caulobacter hibisci TaxID=2035993 RepID=A0ABS0T2A8_9CAUL|nr:hypothetical protein [Caulobacter hibisci]MBI1685866.1 hypothetical protein [Caulobacter hibisci]